MEEIIGRNEEKKILNAALLSKEAELIAVYGRRRIGKTYLIRNFFQKNIRFELTGIHQASLKIQLQNFSLALQSAMNIPVSPAQPNNWIAAFQMLNEYIKAVGDREPIVILFDDLLVKLFCIKSQFISRETF
jgi:AAA+ ATPase superfamily predicted ATPase